MLTALPPELLRGLFGKARTSSLAADQMLFLSGDPGDGCYRVDEGLLKVSVGAPDGGERILAILGPGSIVGELSMIDGAPRSASVCALREFEIELRQPRHLRGFQPGQPGALPPGDDPAGAPAARYQRRAGGDQLSLR